MMGETNSKDSRIGRERGEKHQKESFFPPTLVATENPWGVRITTPRVCKAWAELYRSQDARPLHETLELDLVARGPRPLREPLNDLLHARIPDQGLPPPARGEADEREMHGTMDSGSAGAHRRLYEEAAARGKPEGQSVVQVKASRGFFSFSFLLNYLLHAVS